MKTEVSAGGIVVRKKGKDWEVLVVRDMNDELTFPKGKVETNESLLETAIREIKEEVGVTRLTLLKELPVIRYLYTRNGLISKSVQYFIFMTSGQEKLINQKEEGIHGAVWMPLPAAIPVIGYKKTNMPLLTETQEFLTTYGH